MEKEIPLFLSHAFTSESEASQVLCTIVSALRDKNTLEQINTKFV